MPKCCLQLFREETGGVVSAHASPHTRPCALPWHSAAGCNGHFMCEDRVPGQVSQPAWAGRDSRWKTRFSSLGPDLQQNFRAETRFQALLAAHSREVQGCGQLLGKGLH